MYGYSEAIDLMHFANVIIDATVVSLSLLSINKMRANGVRLIIPGFSIPNGNLRHVTQPYGTCSPTLKELRSEIKEQNLLYYSNNNDK